MADDAEGVLTRLDPPVRAIVERLRALASAALPDAVEETDAAEPLIAYTYKPGTYKHLIAAIAPHSSHVNLMFATGAQLADLDIGARLEGTGKRARHLSFRSVDDIDADVVRPLLEEAARLTPRP